MKSNLLISKIETQLWLICNMILPKDHIWMIARVRVSHHTWWKNYFLKSQWSPWYLSVGLNLNMESFNSENWISIFFTLVFIFLLFLYQPNILILLLDHILLNPSILWFSIPVFPWDQPESLYYNLTYFLLARIRDWQKVKF